MKGRGRSNEAEQPRVNDNSTSPLPPAESSHVLHGRCVSRGSNRGPGGTRESSAISVSGSRVCLRERISAGSNSSSASLLQSAAAHRQHRRASQEDALDHLSLEALKLANMALTSSCSSVQSDPDTHQQKQQQQQQPAASHSPAPIPRALSAEPVPPAATAGVLKLEGDNYNSDTQQYEPVLGASSASQLLKASRSSSIIVDLSKLQEGSRMVDGD